MSLQSVLIVSYVYYCTAILPTAEITIKSDGVSTTASQEHPVLLASEASFGSYVPMKKSEKEASMVFTPRPIPSSNPFLCFSDKSFTVPPSSVLLVPRGVCTFERKALLAQQAGAEAIIIHGSLSSRYNVNSTTGKVIYPEKKYDYDCNYGTTSIPRSEIVLPYKESNDYIMKQYGKTLPKCASEICLLTGKMHSNNQTMQACCAWDLHIWLFSDPNITSTAVTIPALYITMQQFDQLVKVLLSSDVKLQLNQRYRPEYNISGVLIWMLGVFVACLASYLSANDYYRYIETRNRRKSSSISNIGTIPLTQDATTSGAEIMQPLEPRNHFQEEESVDLTVQHALGFIVMASASLLILFYLEIYKLVKVMYGLGCSGAVSQVLFYPMLSRLNQWWKHSCIDLNNPCITTNKFDIGTLTYLDVLSAFLGYTLGITWLILGFRIQHPETNTFYWIVQDVFGACICISFLAVIRIPNLKVASVLLSVAFFYDIFFVFISPLIFDKSVMVTVATSGGPPTADPTWCEKYPDEKDCQGGDPLPMLFTLPRFGDYASGSSMLGLGDIVLPGLLISFCRRIDVAKYMVGLRFDDDQLIRNTSFCDNSKRRSANSCCCTSSYFVPCCIAYAIGLFMANAAVYLMEMGQPALLYLVPCCLGLIVLIAYAKGELHDLWNGPKVLKSCERIMNEGENSSFHEDRSIDTVEPVE